jgi:putative hemolysin
VELGRSFIQPEYRRRHGCLALLWRGIGEFIARNCRYRTLFGPVSISRDYHRVSRNLMVEFLRSTTADQRFLRLVSPRHPFRTAGIRRAPSQKALRSGDLEHISMLVSEIESDGKGVPTLIKHYLKLNGKFISFNVDRHFSDVVDGLVVVDLTQTETRILRRFMGDAGHDAFAAHHAGRGEADVA